MGMGVNQNKFKRVFISENTMTKKKAGHCGGEWMTSVYFNMPSLHGKIKHTFPTTEWCFVLDKLLLKLQINESCYKAVL